MRREREREIGAMGARKESDDGRDEEFKIERLSVGPAESNSVELGAWRPACVRDVVGQAANFSVISDRGLESHSRFTLSQSGSHVRGLVGACGVCVCVWQSSRIIPHSMRSSERRAALTFVLGSLKQRSTTYSMFRSFTICRYRRQSTTFTAVILDPHTVL